MQWLQNLRFHSLEDCEESTPELAQVTPTGQIKFNEQATTVLQTNIGNTSRTDEYKAVKACLAIHD